MSWANSNRELLAREIERVAARIAGRDAVPRPDPEHIEPQPALVVLQRLFDRSPFEYDVIVVGAGLALDAAFAREIEAQGRFTMSGALATLEAPHLDAISPQAPLRRHRLIATAAKDHVLHTRFPTIRVPG